MIPEMVITIAYDDIECHTAIELTQVFFHITAVLQDEVHNVQITVPRLCITAISQPQQGHGRCKMLSSSVGIPIETLRKQGMILPSSLNNACIGCYHARLLCQ